MKNIRNGHNCAAGRKYPYGVYSSDPGGRISPTTHRTKHPLLHVCGTASARLSSSRLDPVCAPLRCPRFELKWHMHWYRWPWNMPGGSLKTLSTDQLVSGTQLPSGVGSSSDLIQDAMCDCRIHPRELAAHKRDLACSGQETSNLRRRQLD